MLGLAPSFYVIGGTLRRDAPCYVTRQADEELRAALRQGQFCYVLTARQMGKSSLMVRTAAQLREEGCGVAILDLTALGQNLTAEQWYRGLLSYLGQQLELEDELVDFWRALRELSPIQRWMRALRDVLLPRYPGQLVIFVDEIDAVLNLPFSTDEFFAAIREFYNRRTEDEELARLTFCLLGVASPADLIRDTRTTPFNIGQRIELRDFTAAESATLAQGLKREEQVGTTLLKRIHHWTGGHPYLTQRLCQAAADEATVRDAAGIDHLCERMFFAPRAQERDDNLLFVRERMLRSEVDRAGLLHLYEQVRAGKRVRDDETNPLVSALRLAGIVRVRQGRLRERNRIYARVFDRAWINANLPDAEQRRQRAAFRRGLWRAAAVAAVIIAALAGLAFVALQQRNFAKEEARRADRTARELEAALAEARGQRQAAVTQKGVAEQKQVEAEQQRQEAINQREIADEQRTRAEGQELDNRWFLYAARLNLAQQAWADADLGRMAELLAYYIPKPGAEDLRGFEWYYLWQLCFGEAFARLGAGVTSLAYSPDGTKLATGSYDRTIKLWDVATGKVLASFKGHRNAISSLAFSPDGKRIATGSVDQTIKLWDVVTGRELMTLRGHTRGIAQVAFAPDGGRLVSGGADNTAKLWNAITGREIATLKGHTDWVTSVAFSPEGNRLATGSRDRTVGLWNGVTGQQLSTFSGYQSAVSCVAFSPDGTKLAAGGWSPVAKLWEAATGRELIEFKGHASGVRTVAFSPDGAKLATGGPDRTARIWEVATGQELATLKRHADIVVDVAFSPDGARVATGSHDRTVRLWDVATGQELTGGNTTLSGVWTTALSPDGTTLATGSADHTVKLWNVATGKQITTLRGHERSIGTVAFAPDSAKLAVAAGNTMKVWEVATERELITLKRPSVVSAVAFSPDGKRLAMGSGDHTVKLWDVATWRELATFKGHTGKVWTVAFSPDGARLASASQDRTIKLWSVVTGQELATLDGHAQAVNSVAFSPDGAKLASGSNDHTIKIWEVVTGKELATFKGHAHRVMNVKYSPDGSRLASGGTDRTIKLWEVNRGLELLTLKGHTKEVWSLAFSPDGARLASGSLDGTVRLWRAAPSQDVLVRPKLLTQTQSAARRPNTRPIRPHLQSAR